MRLHEQLGGEEPDQEVENLLSDQRRAKEKGADLPGPCEQMVSIMLATLDCEWCRSQRGHALCSDHGAALMRAIGRKLT